MGRGDKSLIAKSRSHDQDGCHSFQRSSLKLRGQSKCIHNDLDLFYCKVNFGNIGFHMRKGENKLLQPET